jgi:hypothetical protein
MNPHEIIFMEQSIMFSVRDNEITLGVSNRNKKEEGKKERRKEGKKEVASRNRGYRERR